MNFGLPELLIILVIVLLLFGSTRLPALSRSIGQSLRELREGFTSADPPKKNKKKPSGSSQARSASRSQQTEGSEKSFYRSATLDQETKSNS